MSTVTATPTPITCPPTSATGACGPMSLTGLTAARKWLPPKWFYDKVGSELFEDITRLPEYYPTRTERAILDQACRRDRRAAGSDTLIELGSGSSEKTRLLLDAADLGPGAGSGVVRRAGRQRGRPAIGLRRAGRDRTRRCGSARCGPTSPTSWTCCRAAAPAPSPSSAAPSATSNRPSGPRSCASLRAGLATADTLPARRRPGQVRRRPGAGLRRRRRGDRGVQPERAGRAEPPTGRRLRPHRLRARRGLGCRATSGSRCACGASAGPGGRRCPTSDSAGRRSRRGERSAPRSPPSSAAAGL